MMWCRLGRQKTAGASRTDLNWMLPLEEAKLGGDGLASGRLVRLEATWDQYETRVLSDHCQGSASPTLCRPYRYPNF